MYSYIWDTLYNFSKTNKKTNDLKSFHIVILKKTVVLSLNDHFELFKNQTKWVVQKRSTNKMKKNRRRPSLLHAIVPFKHFRPSTTL